MTPNLILTFAFLIVFNVISLGQFKIVQLNSDFDDLNDSLFLGISESRIISSLNEDWKVFLADQPENSNQISFPLLFTSKEILKYLLTYFYNNM